MDTPSISTNLRKTDPEQSAARGAGNRPSEARAPERTAAGEPAADVAEFTPRAQIESGRGGAARGTSIAGGDEAEAAARAASDQILMHPAVAARAQANSDGATVLSMLQ